MAPKRQHIPIIFLLSLLGLFFLSRHFSPPSALPTPLQTLSSPSPSRFSLTVKLLAYNRLPSLSRCLLSLAAADYAADTVHLHIYIDHFKNSSDSVDGDLLNSRQILDFVDGFRWKFGEKMVHYRSVNVGLQAQWLEAWWPTSDHDFAFVVEDDLEVSPLYYQFLKGLVLNYYYDPRNFNPAVYGASLQRPRFVPGKQGNKMHLDHDTRLFLYQLVGTWGQLLFPRPWKEFRIWYDIHKARGMKPFLDGMVTNRWYKKMGERIWTPWFIKFIHSRGYFNIYTNFKNDQALSVSHRDAGVNYGKTAGPDSNILNESNIDFNLMDMKPLSELKWYDFCFREVLPGQVVEEVAEVGTVLSSLQKQKPVFLISLFKASEPITRNLLCHFERLNVQNYIFVAPKSESLLDLARRGHHVIDADQIFESIMSSMGYLKPSSEPIKEIVVNAYIAKKCLEAGLNTYIVDGERMLLINNLLLDNENHKSDFYACRASGVFYVRSTPSSRKVWEIMLSRATTLVDTIPTQEYGNFASAMAGLLEKQGVRCTTLDATQSIVQLNSISSNQSSLGDMANIIYWPSDIGSDAIKKRLMKLGVWIVDADSSCNAVFCHRS